MTNNDYINERIDVYKKLKSIFTDEIKYFMSINMKNKEIDKYGKKRILFRSNNKVFILYAFEMINLGKQSISYLVGLLIPNREKTGGNDPTFDNTEYDEKEEIYIRKAGKERLANGAKIKFYIKITINLTEVKMYNKIIKKLLLKRKSPTFLFMFGSYKFKYIENIVKKIDNIINTELTTMNKISKELINTRNIVINSLQETMGKYKLIKQLNKSIKELNKRNVTPYILFFRPLGELMTAKTLIRYDVLFRILYGIMALHSIGIIHTDLHVENMIILPNKHEKIDNGYFLYSINNKIFTVPSKKITPIIIDFGISVFLKKLNKFDKKRLLVEYNSSIDINSNNINDKIKLLDYISVVSIVADEDIQIAILLEELDSYVADNSSEQKEFDFNTIFKIFEDFCVKPNKRIEILNPDIPYAV